MVMAIAASVVMGCNLASHSQMLDVLRQSRSAERILCKQRVGRCAQFLFCRKTSYCNWSQIKQTIAVIRSSTSQKDAACIREQKGPVCQNKLIEQITTPGDELRMNAVGGWKPRKEGQLSKAEYVVQFFFSTWSFSKEGYIPSTRPMSVGIFVCVCACMCIGECVCFGICACMCLCTCTYIYIY